jgi:23S rRNA pseudouridine955/2504/2580 synthase
MNELTKSALTDVQVIEIKEDQDGQRVDNYLSRVLKGVPKSRIYRLIRKGQVRVNKGRIKPNHRLKIGDMVRVPPVSLDENTPAKLPDRLLNEIDACVLFENDDCLVVNKPSGLAVHGGSGLQFGLLDVVKAIRPEQDYMELVHRLDRETSGCLILAKNRKTLTFLHDQFKHGKVIKKYLAGVAGAWKGGKKTVSAPLRKNVMHGGERMVEVQADGKAAVSHFTPLQQYHQLCLMEVELETGRTHQIRVHAAYAGHPVAGDKKYGDRQYNQWIKDKGLGRLFLHSHWLELLLPGQDESIQLTTPLPSDLKTVLTNLE